MRVLVIGSGIAGASAAHQLARRGADVVVVDEDRPGVATAAGAGIVCPWTSRRGDDEYRFAAAAAAYYPDLVAQLAEDGAANTSFEVVGGMIVSADETELDEEYRRVGDRVAGEPAAGRVERLDQAQARELFPALAPGLAAVHVSGGGRVDGRRMRQALLDAAVRRGARIVQGRAALTPRGLRIGDEELAGDRVVVAAGAWTGELLPAVPVAPQRGQISHFELPGTDTARWPVVLPVSSHYLLAFPGSRVVAGATRETGSGFDHRVTAAGQREVLDHALTVAPGLAEATLLETRVGFRPASPDGLPLLGPLEDRPDVLIATGFGHGGLTAAPFAGRLIACLALGEEITVDLEPYRPERFTGR
ncbi:NAD(P)/FAD-dependent oxidoreductase [Amycolatopsis thermophila]|uniref:D-amino-acid dehydrogenase n=1 Tax=Amycolatopsis thermophila TaxID=206084 RepID=A0ABU0ENQ7_9PSEU|nr:FAD-dependent oxidoreductase [Amycolatopsis thermophila]MDQ0376673.1 D-amino-acid dehydrogenase [Amycolatopsis thermophila]